MRYSNRQLEAMASSLSPVLKIRSVVGYKAAVNMRAILDATREYIEFKDKLIREYGTEVKDENGNVVNFAVTAECDGYQAFLERLKEVSEIERDVEIIKATTDDVIGVLSGEEIMAIDWMMEHEGE